MAIQKWAATLCLVLSLGSAATAELRVSWIGHDNMPTKLVVDPIDPSYMYTVGRFGRIRTVQDFQYLPTPDSFALFPAGTVAMGGERAMSNLAFSPNFVNDGFAYVTYNRASDGAVVIERYNVLPGLPRHIDFSTAFTILVIPAGNWHFGGGATFGPDGYLWVFCGDGENYLNSQNTGVLNGKILRVDPTSDDFPLDPDRNYSIPPDNPFVDGNPIAAPTEAVHFGVRNPWRSHWDAAERGGTDSLLIGDVGADAWEEINFAKPGEFGLNFEWPRLEGLDFFGPGFLLAYNPGTPPIHAEPHPNFVAIVGGEVYRGMNLGPAYYGRYFFGDAVLSKLYSAKLSYDEFTLAPTLSDFQDHTEEIRTGVALGQIWSVDTDADGELMLVSNSRLHKVIPFPARVPRSVVFALGFSDLEGPEARPKVVTVTVKQENLHYTFQIAPDDKGQITVSLFEGPQSVTVKVGTWLSESVDLDTDGFYPRKIVKSLVNGDANQDDSIDIADYSLLSSAMFTNAGDLGYTRYADFDGSGSVDIADFAILSTNFGDSR